MDHADDGEVLSLNTLGRINHQNTHVGIFNRPQRAHVAVRAGVVARQTGQRILGVIENMSWLEQDGKRTELFGAGGGQQVADALTDLAKTEVKLLGQVPISVPLRECSDAGTPVVLAQPNDAASQAIATIAKLVAADKLVRQSKSLRLNT